MGDLNYYSLGSCAGACAGASEKHYFYKNLFQSYAKIRQCLLYL